MVKIIILSALLIAQSFLYGQGSSSASASTSAEIILPVGAEKSGDLTITNFNPKSITGRLVIKNNKIILKPSKTILESAGDVLGSAVDVIIPSFHIFSGKSSYAINEPIYIEEFSVLPFSTNDNKEKNRDGFSIGTVLRLNPSQAPGHYFSQSAYTVAIHFN